MLSETPTETPNERPQEIVIEVAPAIHTQTSRPEPETDLQNSSSEEDQQSSSTEVTESNSEEIQVSNSPVNTISDQEAFSSLDFEALTKQARQLFVSIFCDPKRVLQLNVVPLQDFTKETIKKIIKGKNGEGNIKEFQLAIADAYGVLTKFYSKNALNSIDLQHMHYEILIIGDTSSGKDATIANLTQVNIAFSGEGMTTKFPERIIKTRTNEKNTFYLFYKQSDNSTPKRFDTLTALNDYRQKAHAALSTVCFDVHVIEIHSAEKNVIPVSILNLPGFVAMKDSSQKSVGKIIFDGLANEVKRLCSKGIGSIYIVRNCKRTTEMEYWPLFFLDNKNMDPKLFEKLELVFVHTRSDEKVYATKKNGDIDIPRAIKTFNSLLNDCQVDMISKLFREHSYKTPSHIFIENWDHQNDDFNDSKDDESSFIQFLKKNNDSFMEKIDNLEQYFAGISSSNDRNAFLRFKSHFGIDALRDDFLQKISKPTLAQVEGLCHGLISGASNLHEMLRQCYHDLQQLDTTKLGGRIEALCSQFTQARAIISDNTSHRFEISQKELKNLEISVFKTAYEEYESLTEAKVSFYKICEGDMKKVQLWEETLKKDINGNLNQYIEFKSTSKRFKQNLFDWVKHIPFEGLDEKHFNGSATFEQYSVGKSKKDALNQHILRELQRKLSEFAPFIAKYLAGLWHSRTQALLTVVVEQYGFQDLSGEIISQFEETLRYIYYEQLEKVLEYDIKEYASKNFLQVDPDTLSIANEIIGLEKNISHQKILRDFFESKMDNSSEEALKILKNLVQENTIIGTVSRALGTKVEKQKNQIEEQAALECNYKAAVKYINTSFYASIRKSIVNMWETVIEKNFMSFFIYNKDLTSEIGFLVKIVIMKMLGVQTVFNFLQDEAKFGFELPEILKTSGTLKIQPIGQSTFFPPKQLEGKASEQLGSQGLIPFFDYSAGTEAKLNSFFLPLRSDVKSRLQEKLDENSYGPEVKTQKIKLFKQCFLKLHQISKGYEELGMLFDGHFKDLTEWIDTFKSVTEMEKKILKPKDNATIKTKTRNLADTNKSIDNLLHSIDSIDDVILESDSSEDLSDKDTYYE